jgi:phosphoglycolate phosphatase
MIAFTIVKKCCEKFLKEKISKKDFIEIYKSNFYKAMKKHGATRKQINSIKEYALKWLAGKKPNIHPGVKSMVKKLSETHKIAVVSSNYDDIMRKNLKRNGILKNFHYILGVEEGENKKNKIKALLKKTKTGKSEALFITDTVGDIREAKKANVKTMAVTWGFHTKAMLKKENPDFIADKSISIQEVTA